MPVNASSAGGARLLRILLLVALLAPGAARSGDGVAEINQARALAGGVTPGDAPGFPVTIAESGSYRLTSDLVHDDPDLDFIVVSAAHVQLDLNGFALRGPNSCLPLPCEFSALGRGIAGTERALTVRNGSIYGAGGEGIDASGNAARVIGLRVTQCGKDGIATSGSHSVVEDSLVSLNGWDGIRIGEGGRVQTSSSSANGVDGIACSSDCSVLDSASIGNEVDGIYGAAGTQLVRGNRVTENKDEGIDIANGSVLDNVVEDNTSTALHVSGGPAAYARNRFVTNNGGNTNPQVSGNAIQIGSNLCGTDLLCP